MMHYVQVMTATDSEDEAVRLGRLITEGRLAACVQIVNPIRSLYWWEGKVQDEREWLLVIKTTRELFRELEGFIKANHSYEVPEITMTAIEGGSAEYLSWISEQTKRTDAS
jgi:periplasmic divalent cation tolerance protein